MAESPRKRTEQGPRLPRKKPKTAVATLKESRAEVFLNIPYDKQFERLFLAYIAGISAIGMVPRATLEITDSSRRLEKILKLARSCQYSVHDLSRVELDRAKPRTPRFNMPFELGLCVADANRRSGQEQNWFVFEAMANRVKKSLSDLDGTDPKIHGATVRGVLGSLCNIFERSGRQPTVPQMMQIYRVLRKNQAAILREAGSHTLYTKRVFADLCVAASERSGRAVQG
jgi:hypothetical protein